MKKNDDTQFLIEEIMNLKQSLENAHNMKNNEHILTMKYLEENKQLKEEIESLTECLNGSSKAVYTAEMYDKLLEENERLKNRELSKDKIKVIISDKTFLIDAMTGQFTKVGNCIPDDILSEIVTEIISSCSADLKEGK